MTITQKCKFWVKASGMQYVAMYAHCRSFVGPDNQTINMGKEVAYSGCTDVPSCGTELSGGGRTDHVHFGLYEGQTIGDVSGKPIDPVTLFHWSPVFPTNVGWFADLRLWATHIFRAVFGFSK